jgi:hypothetical protein
MSDTSPTDPVTETFEAQRDRLRAVAPTATAVQPLAGGVERSGQFVTSRSSWSREIQ